jgi:hypothetical protein
MFKSFGKAKEQLQGRRRIEFVEGKKPILRIPFEHLHSDFSGSISSFEGESKDRRFYATIRGAYRHYKRIMEVKKGIGFSAAMKVLGPITFIYMPEEKSPTATVHRKVENQAANERFDQRIHALPDEGVKPGPRVMTVMQGHLLRKKSRTLANQARIDAFRRGMRKQVWVVIKPMSNMLEIHSERPVIRSLVRNAVKIVFDDYRPKIDLSKL